MRVVGAVLVGNENHGDGNAGIGENGRVVASPRGQAHRGNASVTGAFDETIRKRGINDSRGRAQGVVEFETNAALGFDAPRFFKKQRVEAFEHVGRETAHVDREGGFAGNDGNRSGRRGRQYARREDEVLPRFVPFGPVVFHAGEEPRGRHHRVVAINPIERSGVSGFTVADDALVADVAANARHHGGAHLGIAIEHRALFDMKFDEGGDFRRVDDGTSRHERARVDALRANGRLKCFSRRAVLELQVRFGETPHHAERAHVGLAEE